VIQRSTNVLRKHTLENIKNLKHNQTLPKQSEHIPHKAAQESGSWIQCLWCMVLWVLCRRLRKKIGPFSPSLRVASDCARLDAAHSIKPFENPTDISSWHWKRLETSTHVHMYAAAQHRELCCGEGFILRISEVHRLQCAPRPGMPSSHQRSEKAKATSCMSKCSIQI